MFYFKYILLPCFVFLLVFTGCHTTQYLDKGQRLYLGGDVHLHNAGDSSRIKNTDLQEELAGILRPEPNSTLLGIPYKLYFYNLAGNPKKQSGWRTWIRKKWGEAPVIATDAANEKNRTILQNRLENRGYFFNNVVFDTVNKKKTQKVIFDAYMDSVYRIRNLTFASSDTAIPYAKTLNRMTRFIARRIRGKAYNLDNIKDIYDRMDQRLKQQGYYYFSSDYLLSYVDSTVGHHQADIKIVLKNETPNIAREQFRINDIVVFADYNLGQDTSLVGVKHIPGDSGYFIVDKSNFIKPNVFSNLLGFHQGDLYNRSAHSLALNRLTTLGVYKFVKARFEETDTVRNKGKWLNAYYYLTPSPVKSLLFEVSGYTKSNSSNGTEMSLNWRHKNFLHGAELFNAKIYGSMERQVLKNAPNVSTRKIGADVSLTIPKILAPFKIKTYLAFVPQTKMNIGYEFFTRSSQYTLTSLNTNFGYIFKQTATKEHQLNALAFTFVRPTHITPDFQLALDTNVVLRRSIERLFIIGSNYNFNYNSLNDQKNNFRRVNYYFNANIDLSGNLLGLITRADVNKGRERKFFNSPFSQYVRAEIDGRQYLRINRNVTLASRAVLGAGYSWGNSTSMPFVKSFFVGGPNDLRAFSTRSLGPGIYYAGNPRFSTRYLGDQPGDMKMLFNSELRAKLFSFLYGALFVDAGNTWLLRKDADRPGGEISTDFYKQIAIGSGAGLRVDASILWVRLDLGIPVRSPHETDGFQWNFKEMNWKWLQHNWIWNIAIGLPF